MDASFVIVENINTVFASINLDGFCHQRLDIVTGHVFKDYKEPPVTPLKPQITSS